MVVGRILQNIYGELVDNADGTSELDFMINRTYSMAG